VCEGEVRVWLRGYAGRTGGGGPQVFDRVGSGGEKSEWKRRERLVDEVRLAEGLKVRVLVGKFFEVVIELDSAPDISLGGG